MSEKFQAIHFASLTNAAFMAFHDMVITESALIKGLSVGNLLEDYKADVLKLKDQLVKYTESNGIKVADADKNRDDIYQHGRAYARAMMDHYDGEKALAGAKVYGVFKAHPDALKASNLEESGIITKVLADLNSVGEETLARIDFVGWVNQLQQAQDTFIEAVTRQTAENATKEYGVVKNQRNILINDYRKLTQAVETFTMLGVNGCAEFIAHVNAYIQKVSSSMRKPSKKAEEAASEAV